MDEKFIVSKINEFLHSATKELCAWLNRMLPRAAENWWRDCVLANLSYGQREIAEAGEFTTLEQFDLAALLRIADKSWYAMRTFAYLPTKDRTCVREMLKVRNNWAHCAGNLPEKDKIFADLDTILAFFENVIITNSHTAEIYEFRAAVDKADISALIESKAVDVGLPAAVVSDGDIKERDTVYLTGEPGTKGMVFSVSEIDGIKKYEVFVNGEIRTFFEGQIVRIDPTPTYHWVDIDTFRSALTAFEINNPSSGNLYSLNAARIDFVPYQFRPALKMIKADEPRILIADSVGVGKTIEAGLIVKEMEARGEMENILIICPKPLVAERKWETEMHRFDEDFSPLDGETLRQVLSDTHRDELWPARYSKAIIPYSILDRRAYEGNDEEGKREYGLLELDPAPHFDLVIIDEAHHIRNGNMDKDKAFAYKCVRYFCEHADAVVMLTATPLQTSDDDLFTLLNLLRPDIVMDKDVFEIMSQPNEYIYRASHAVRAAYDGWQEEAEMALGSITATQWGENVIGKNPLYTDILQRLEAPEISREERVRLISDIESLHTFNTMLNRTRRRDIQDFCIRRSYTVETEFTPEQAELHNELLRFEKSALSVLHNARSVPFMMSTIRRQAASCIFGLAPQIEDIVNRRFAQINDDPELDADEFDGKISATLSSLAGRVMELAAELPDEDPKFDSIVKIIQEKQEQPNNKIILFSTFRHTLNYLFKKLTTMHYRVAQIDGSVKDEDRRRLRERFELDRNDPDALDMLLFTEVGSEGLDYQFCDMMINYDLPWNPMRIEQRIGRIDRRGQKSEAVSIYNIITADTVDADIYSRCLMRIGVFERSIGECEEVLGSIGEQIEKLALNTELTDDERRMKLEQMADNEIRRMLELAKLEDEERSLFGFDLSNYTTSREIEEAESPWLSPQGIQNLVERYLNERLGKGQYIIGSSDMKTLRLGKDFRTMLLEDYRGLSNVKSDAKRKWELYLKGREHLHSITFVSEAATKNPKAFFITPMHPLVKQAAKHLTGGDTSYLHLECKTDEYPEGRYPFLVYAWNYIGIQPVFKVVPICSNPDVERDLLELLQMSDSDKNATTVEKSTWDPLEARHVSLWRSELSKHVEEVSALGTFRIESIGSNYRNRKRNLEQKIANSISEKITIMYRSELQTATENYEAKVAEINARTSRADIHTMTVAKGIIDIKKG